MGISIDDGEESDCLLFTRRFSMNPQDEAAWIKDQNVIDMAIAFTGMTRVFEKGSKQKIAKRLESTLGSLAEVDNKDKFEIIHSEFCEWFVGNIKTANRERKNKVIKKSRAASYGQAGKVFNIVLKVYVYYCGYPNNDAAAKLFPLLHAGIDTVMMKNLKENHPQKNIKARTIEAVDKPEYMSLQKLVKMQIEDKFDDQIFPVQWDDIMWYRLNR
jgi:hypothetical protein